MQRDAISKAFEQEAICGFYVNKLKERKDHILIIELRATMTLFDHATGNEESNYINSFVGLVVDEDTYSRHFIEDEPYTFVAKEIHKKL